ncbi:hypothetical protein KKB18_02760, partial [bacterium]|nr:hypothetical protein [bacterium]
CSFLGFFVINSILITERLKRKAIFSVVLFLLLFIIHSLLIKAIIPGIGKLFEISGFAMGTGILLGRRYTNGFVSRAKAGFVIMSLVFLISFVFIGLRYFIGTLFLFKVPIDLQIWFSWTLMSTWVALLIGFEGYIN